MGVDIRKTTCKTLSLRQAALETTLGQMTAPKNGHPRECYLNQVAFHDQTFALDSTPGWKASTSSFSLSSPPRPLSASASVAMFPTMNLLAPESHREIGMCCRTTSASTAPCRERLGLSAEEPAPAPHLACPKGCCALRNVLDTACSIK